MNVYYLGSKKELYQSQISAMAGQLAQLLDDPRNTCIEISRSRSGLKITKITRKHEVVAREVQQ